MAMAVLCSLYVITPQHHSFFRNQSKMLLKQKKCKLKDKITVYSCSSHNSKPNLSNGLLRRDLLLFGLSSSMPFAFPSSGAFAEEDLKMEPFVDETNAYTYLYPRVTSTQRLAESSLLDAHTSEAQESNLYRHNIAATAERDGYLYTLNASTLSKQWDKMGPFLEKTVATFRLLSPTDNYVPPYKDPWRFWWQAFLVVGFPKSIITRPTTICDPKEYYK